MTSGRTSGKIAIAGAGIAGLGAAISLRIAGFPVEVFEREQVLGEIGAGIQMGPNAARIMEAWNLDLLGSAVEPDNLEVRNARTGALLNTVPLKRGTRVRYNAPHLTLMRADLQKALVTRARELDIPIHFGTPIGKITDMGLNVIMEAGGNSQTVSAVVGSDGIKSATRALAGFEVRRVPAQAVAWRTMLPLEAVPAEMRSSIVLWMASGAHLVHYPVSGGKLLNAVAVIDDVYQRDGLEQEDYRAYLAERLQGWSEVPLSAIASAEEWLKWRMAGIEKWDGGKGRVQFIGDAWHAMHPYLASGGVMAIEDGAALAESLTEAQGNIVEGFKLFRKNRGSRVWQVAQASAQAGLIFHLPPPFDMVRDLVIRFSSGSGLLGRNDWLYGEEN